MKIEILQHVPFESAGSIIEWAEKNHHTCHTTHLYREAKLPAANSFDLLIIMGGPMSIHDTLEYPWLEQEKEFIRQATDSGKLVLGICLGAQLIASSMGAEVYQNPQKEIGWFEVTPSDNALPWFEHPFTAFHWHGETFSLPPGATLLASSEACPNQAFIVDDRILALQFHLEITPDGVQALLKNCADEIRQSPWIQSEHEIAEETHNFHELLNHQMDRILSLLTRS